MNHHISILRLYTFMATKMVRIFTVSYTHLDVYKRQESGKQPAAVYSGRTGGINLQKTVDNTVIRWYSQMVVKKQVEYPLSVSYTHLDVYKRQVYRTFLLS